MNRDMLTRHPPACGRGPNLFSDVQVEVLVIDMGSVAVGMRACCSCKARPPDSCGDDETFVNPGAIDWGIVTESLDETRAWDYVQVVN
jgi:hypothetical protein